MASESQPLIRKYDHKHELSESIYDALIYAPAVTRVTKTSEAGKKDRVQTVFCMAFVNFLIQLGLLIVMSVYGWKDAAKQQIISTNPKLAMQQDLLAYGQFHVKKRGGSTGGFLSEAEDEAENAEEEMEARLEAKPDTICTLHKGKYRCAPTSIRFNSEWHSLDKNGDGVWSIDEAMGSDDGSSQISTRRTVYFRIIINSLKTRAQLLQEQHNKTLYLSQDIVTARGIPKAYFDYWRGDAQFCSRFGSDSAICKWIASSGIFNSALTKGKLAAEYKGIFDYSSAVEYCSKMLETHGFCEQSLPANYVKSVWKRQSVCGKLSMESSGVFTSPHDDAEVFQVMTPKFAKLSAQERTLSGYFLFFMVMILYLFLASLVAEAKAIFRVVDLITNFPGLYNKEDPGGADNGPEADFQYEIHRMSHRHRMILIFTTILRLIIVVVLTVFGTWFLLIQTNYVELVLNALALVFITDVDEMIYTAFLDPIDKKDLGLYDNCKTIEYQGYVPKNDDDWRGKLCARHNWGLFVVPILAVSIVMYYQVGIRNGRIEALNCACLQKGPNCLESLDNQGEWWDHYWSHTLPTALAQVEGMRVQGI